MCNFDRKPTALVRPYEVADLKSPVEVIDMTAGDAPPPALAWSVDMMILLIESVLLAREKPILTAPLGETLIARLVSSQFIDEVMSAKWFRGRPPRKQRFAVLAVTLTAAFPMVTAVKVRRLQAPVLIIRLATPVLSRPRGPTVGLLLVEYIVGSRSTRNVFNTPLPTEKLGPRQPSTYTYGNGRG